MASGGSRHQGGRGASTTLHDLHAVIRTMQSSMDSLHAKVDSQQSVIHSLHAKVDLQHSVIQELRLENLQHGASSHHVLFLVAAQAAFDLEIMLTNAYGSMSKGALNNILRSRGVDLKVFWILRGARRLDVAHPPLDYLEDEHVARAAKVIATDGDLVRFWSVAAAFAAERR